MTINPSLFQAFLKCPTKCWLLSVGEQATGNAYAEWLQSQTETYRVDGIRRLEVRVPPERYAVAPPPERLRLDKWQLAVAVEVQNQKLQTHIHGLERTPAEGLRGQAQFVPIRFIFTNKVSKDDRLLLAYDALLLSEKIGQKVAVGKIIHGENRATLKVKTVALFGDVRKQLEKIGTLQSNTAPPDLILNQHCGECEFQRRCKQKAIEKDELSLLSKMKEKERKKFNSEGTFTVTQLSYTFRPRRRPKRLRDKRERYHHSLKALAIREKKTHIVGTPELKIDGTPIYLDVEGLPDRDFYYLIGARVKTEDAIVQHSFWANDIEGERTAWNDFLVVCSSVEQPVLVHYGSFETTFLRRMAERYGEPPEDSGAAKAMKAAINLLTIIFAQVYFPTYSNGLKEIASYLGFKWSDAEPSGLSTIIWRHSWEMTSAPDLKSKLLQYNTEDCLALETVSAALERLSPGYQENGQQSNPDHTVVHTELLPQKTMWPRFISPISEFEQVNKAARWNYQRDRIYVR